MLQDIFRRPLSQLLPVVENEYTVCEISAGRRRADDGDDAPVNTIASPERSAQRVADESRADELAEGRLAISQSRAFGRWEIHGSIVGKFQLFSIALARRYMPSGLPTQTQAMTLQYRVGKIDIWNEYLG
jgi:hypothetical protein